MAWKKGIVIRSGELEGSTIGISSLVPEISSVYQTNYCHTFSQTYQNQGEHWYNSDFDKQIEVSSYFKSDGAVFSEQEIASIAIKDDNGEVSGFISIYLTRASATLFYIDGKIKNSSGAVVGTFRGSHTVLEVSASWYPSAKAYLCFAENTYNNHKIVSIYFNTSQSGQSPYGGYFSQVRVGYIAQDMNVVYSQWGISGHIDDDVKTKSPEFGPASTPSGGYNDIPNNPHGTFDDSSDEIALDAKPIYGVTSVGFINVYKIEQNELINLGEKLFPHFLPAEILADPSQLSVQEILVWFIKMAYGTLLSPTGTSIELTDNLGIFDILMNGKLIDYVLDCHVIPTSISGATISPLKIGYRTFNDFQLAKATEDYVDVDCGELYIKEFYGNFLDYSGNLKVELYLPMVGFVPIDNEFWNNATIKVIYRFNIIDGSFQAKVFTTREDDKSKIHNSLVAQYGGVCCVHFPITGLQYSNVISGLVNGGAGAVANKANGNVAGAVSNVFNMAMLRPDNPSSNGYNASSSFLSHRTPYLVIKMPVAQFSENYPKEIGLPLNVTYPLSQIHGFTIIENPVLNIRCSDEEYNELVSLLRSGVIF